MNDRDLIHTGERAAERLTRLIAWVQTPGRNDQRTPIQRNRDGWHGHPKAAAYDRSEPSGHPRHDTGIIDADPDLGWRRTTSDPTGDAATRPDRAAASRKRVERALKGIAAHLDAIDRELVDWAEPRPATDYERRLIEQENGPRPPGCSACEDIDPGRPVHLKGYCRRCYDFYRRNGRPPTEAELKEAHNPKATGSGKLRARHPAA